jgi:heptosyltransferase-3
MRFLINRSDAIGDAILTTPMAKMLKEKFPDCHISFLISAKSVDVFKNHPYVDSYFIYHRHARFYFKIREIFRIFMTVRPTHYFFVGGGYFPNVVSWLMRIPFRGGLKSRWHTYLFLNNGVRQKRSMVTMHEMEFNLNLLAPLDIQYNHDKYLHFSPEVKLTDEEISSSWNLFIEDLKAKNYPIDKKIIFVHPGMTGHTLNWSSRNYGRFIIKMNQKFPGKFLYLVSYTPSDDTYMQGLKAILNRSENKEILENVYFFNGIIHGLRNYMAVLSKASLFLGPSTGTTHLAAILNVPVVGIYSPIKVQSKLRWGPIHREENKCRVLVPDVVCGEIHSCAERACPYYECMGKIEVEDVIKEAISIMDL